MFNFCWDDFSLRKYNDLAQAAAYYEPSYILRNDYYGKVHVGELCFDVLLIEYPEYEHDGVEPRICFDCYVAHVDSGYGYSGDQDMPYDYADGISVPLRWLEWGYEEFKRQAELLMTEFIFRDKAGNGYSLIDKARMPLLIW